jgi:hypothetical protein
MGKLTMVPPARSFALIGLIAASACQAAARSGGGYPLRCLAAPSAVSAEQNESWKMRPCGILLCPSMTRKSELHCGLHMNSGGIEHWHSDILLTQ